MDKFASVTAKIIPLPIKDIDTDMIYPAQFLTSTSRTGCGKHLFARLKESDVNFPFNQEKYNDARIIVADDNFGCGSSREHAVWSIYDAGIRVIISKSFADIFYNNSSKNGLLLVVLPAVTVDDILANAKSGDYVVTVDLTNQTLKLPDKQELKFDYDPFRKYCLLNGLDDIDYMQSCESEIAQFREKQRLIQKFSTLVANN
jgi:3-isopropylmalate/(R)-2-methylmalate dehydratase small subunit